MFLTSSCSCICPIQWSQVLSREWRCSWSSAGRRCSSYIWVIDNFIAYQGATYIRDLTVLLCSAPSSSICPTVCRSVLPIHRPTIFHALEQSFHYCLRPFRVLRHYYMSIVLCIVDHHKFSGLVQGCSISIANALEILQSAKPSLLFLFSYFDKYKTQIKQSPSFQLFWQKMRTV